MCLQLFVFVKLSLYYADHLSEVILTRREPLRTKRPFTEFFNLDGGAFVLIIFFTINALF